MKDTDEIAHEAANEGEDDVGDGIEGVHEAEVEVGGDFAVDGGKLFDDLLLHECWLVEDEHVGKLMRACHTMETQVRRSRGMRYFFRSDTSCFLGIVIEKRNNKKRRFIIIILLL